MSAFASGPAVTSESLDAVLLEIDTRTAAVQTSSTTTYHSLRGLIEFYEGVIHTRLDSSPVPEGADKRRIYTKIEALHKRHAVVNCAEAMLTEVLSKSLEHLQQQEAAEGSLASPRFSGGSVHPIATSLQLPPLTTAPHAPTDDTEAAAAAAAAAAAQSVALEAYIDDVLESVDQSLSAAKVRVLFSWCLHVMSLCA